MNRITQKEFEERRSTCYSFLAQDNEKLLRCRYVLQPYNDQCYFEMYENNTEGWFYVNGIDDILGVYSFLREGQCR